MRTVRAQFWEYSELNAKLVTNMSVLNADQYLTSKILSLCVTDDSISNNTITLQVSGRGVSLSYFRAKFKLIFEKALEMFVLDLYETGNFLTNL